jgi:hypothetical protein
MFDEKAISIADEVYIKTTLSEYLEELTKAVEEAEGRKKDAGGCIELTDQLIFVNGANLLVVIVFIIHFVLFIVDCPSVWD